ncbi:MAG: DNA-binding protein [Clostridia bacterium]|nr:DNA-binding protein [Clostridia bacterium]
MEDNIEITLLYDIYGKLLTEKQQEIFENYYLYNLSLREIAENKKISYQAVRDSIKSSEAMLRNFEEKVEMLTLVKRVQKARSICEKTDINKYKKELLELLK